MAAIYSTSNKEGVDVNQVFILDPVGTPEFPAAPFGVGDLCWGTDGSEFVYCTASITLAGGSVVLISTTASSFSVALVGGSSVTAAGNVTGMLVGVTGGTSGSLAVPAPSGTQRGTYFWVQRAGNAPNVKTLATCVKLTTVYSSATLAGVVTTTNGGTNTAYQITGLVISNANGSVNGPNTAVLNYPVVGLTA